MISKEEVLKIAKLSKLTLSDEEIEKYSSQIGDILNYVELLNQLDTSNVEPTTRIIPVNNVFREDEIKEGLSIEKVLLNAPDKKDNMFKVPKI
ncbi:MAG: aspartyl/glutamyl-tRNA(Asn/Gln) amidotransferase subunit C [Candidatus Sericytochromatia bacterium]|nr:MAG: aspartyl/glutamyl-tRNA(Asn/Gln) amidotransferase subunit C [Candidatus Sericytochromatia bacterium]